MRDLWRDEKDNKDGLGLTPTRDNGRPSHFRPIDFFLLQEDSNCPKQQQAK